MRAVQTTYGASGCRSGSSGKDAANLTLDTDTASYAIRGSYPVLDARPAMVVPRDMAISVITRTELLLGLDKRGNPRGLARVVHAFLDRIAILPLDNAAADTFASPTAQCASSFDNLRTSLLTPSRPGSGGTDAEKNNNIVKTISYRASRWA